MVADINSGSTLPEALLFAIEVFCRSLAFEETSDTGRLFSLGQPFGSLVSIAAAHLQTRHLASIVEQRLR
jgi:hypothetical protein